MTTSLIAGDLIKKKVYPKFATEASGLFNKITKVDHPFLQAIIDRGAIVIFMQGEFTVMGYESLALLFIYEDAVDIECISTPVDYRGKGSASRLMQAFCILADLTKTKLTLRTANVTGNGWQIAQHLVVSHGMAKKGKIPVGKLPEWYQKFGFTKVGKVMARGKCSGWAMVRNPVTDVCR